MISVRNFLKAIRSQSFKDFKSNKNAWRIIKKSSHIDSQTGNPKVKYRTYGMALSACRNIDWPPTEPYKCAYCDGYHIGVNR